MSLHRFKPAFQDLVRPLARWVHANGGSANQLTAAAALGSVAVGGAVASVGVELPAAFLVLPAWSLVRMALNAMDGLVARELAAPTRLGAYLNELGDPVADAALVLPFARIQPFADAPMGVVAVALFASWAELAGVLGVRVGASRRYDGPLGKSDRAVVLGAVALGYGLFGHLPAAAGWVMPGLAILSALTAIVRVRAGLLEAGGRGWVDR